jgi:hypothetical protein
MVLPGPVLGSGELDEVELVLGEGEALDPLVVEALDEDELLGLDVVEVLEPAKLIFMDTSSPPASPKVISQVSPAAISAAVGGQGYLAASVAAFPPLLSVPLAAGPTVPV